MVTLNWSDAEIKSFHDEHRWLSNFWPCEIEFEGVKYASVEFAYQAAKTLDPKEREAVRACDTPGKAKRMGKKVAVRSDWETVKVRTMRLLVGQKFKDPALRAKLLATGMKVLVEGNSWGDRFWGAVWDGDAKVLDGGNMLGRILMNVRDEIRLATQHPEPNIDIAEW